MKDLHVQVIGFAVFEFALAAIIIMLTVASLVKAQGANMRRYISVFTGLSLVGLIIFYVVRVNGGASAGFTDIVLLAFANMTAFVIIVQVCLYAAPYQRWSITIVDAGCAHRSPQPTCGDAETASHHVTQVGEGEGEAAIGPLTPSGLAVECSRDGRCC
jgi:hypothetical protein